MSMEKFMDMGETLMEKTNNMGKFGLLELVDDNIVKF
jgi:hypothetical protein